MKVSKEPIVDFSNVKSDLMKFLSFEEGVKGFRLGAYHGSIHIEFSEFKKKLIPIPMRAI
jgi:hypothetical protein